MPKLLLNRDGISLAGGSPSNIEKSILGFREFKTAFLAALGTIGGALALYGQATQPIVAVHDSEFTRALESMPAVAPTPTGPGTTGNQWWPTDWHYFVMPESLKEAFRSDGTAYTVVGDSNIISGALLTNGQPAYPIVFSLCSEALRDDEIAPLTNYVAAGGFLFVGGSAFTRNTNGNTRSDFAFANELGLHVVVNGVTNWAQNNNINKLVDQRLTAHLPSGQLTWRMPSSSEEIPWGISPSHPFLAPHDVWQVTANGATVLAQGDTYPFLTIRQFGKGYFIYCSAFQPIIGHSGFAPSMYAYMIFKRAIEWAFENATAPIARLSPWPFQYDAAFMVRHDLENFTNEITNIEASAQFEFNHGVKGDYYFCTGTLRDDASPAYNTNLIVQSLRRSVTNYGATIGPHNGGLKNPNNPSLVRGQYDYWHWGPDEALDITPAGYPNGKAYAMASLSNSWRDVESWLTGITNGLRSWVACYFNGTRENSYDIQAQLGVKIAGDQKITPFPHWTLSTLTPGKRYSFLTEPVSDWFVGGLVAQSLEPWHQPGVQTVQTLHSAIDFYFNQGFLINFYSHTMSTGLGDAGGLVPEYIVYCQNTNLHPRIWPANGALIYQWWVQRSNAQVTASYSTNGLQSFINLSISGSTSTNTAVEAYVPFTNGICSLQVATNGVPAGGNSYRTNGQLVRVLVGTSVTNVSINFYPLAAPVLVFSENFDSVTAPGLPSGWTSSATNGESPFITQATNRDTVPNAAFCPDASSVGLTELVSPPIDMPIGMAQLSFMNNYDLEINSTNSSDAFDGGVLEIKIGTNGFTDILAAGGSFVSGGYTAPINMTNGNPLAGRLAWSGTSGAFIPTVVNLPLSASGQTIQLKWRCGTDGSTGYSGWRIDTIGVSSRACLCCTGSNNPPVLPAQANRTIGELTALSVTNTATDLDNNALTYFLINPPAGATININGVVNWTPSEAQGPGVYTLTTVVTDNGFPAMSATNSFSVTVTEVNSAPVLPLQTNRTISEMVLCLITNTATDSDIPANTLTYSLVNPPTGATINSNGVITWTPTEAQGPGSYTLTTVVTDNGSPPLSATNSFNVFVAEVNTAPTFVTTPQNQTVAPGTALTITNAATDSDIPPNNLSYSLLSPPSGAAISPAGIITWTPTAGQNRTTNLFRTVVMDDGTPPLSATNTFTIVVNGDPVLTVNSTALALEGCLPTNNAIDPGETVSILFSIKNSGLGSTSNLVATLLQTNGVIPSGSAQSYGVIPAGGGIVTQPFTLANSGSCGGSITAVLQLQDGAANLGTVSATFPLGSVVTVLTQNFDSVTAPALPAGWTTTASASQLPWFTTNTVADTVPNAAFSTDANNVGINELVSPAFMLPAGSPQLSFRHAFAFETDLTRPTNAFDGGVLEIKIGTNAFVDITNAGGVFLTNGYNEKVDSRWSNPLTNRWCWSGTNGYITTIVALPPAAGQSIQLRWRAGTDNGNAGGGWRVDSIAVTGSGCCVGSTPSLASQTDRTIAELTTLTVTNTATDPNAPPGGLVYSLLSPPTGAAIDANGLITWTPSEAQGPGTYTITTVVTDNSYPPLGATNSFTVTVNEVNSPPSLTVPANQTIDELTTLNVSASATDSDIPANTLTFSLLSPPSGMSINPATGAIAWTPTEAQGPSTNLITVVVTDNGIPPMSATNSFIVTVNEVNSAPVLTVPANQTINELSTLMVSVSASDSDIPANILTFSLLAPPTGMSINPATGGITWTPTEAQGPSTNLITVVVGDNGVPPLSATNSFTVTVLETNSAPVLPGVTNCTIDELTTLTVTNTASDPDIPANILTYSLLAPPANASIDTNGIITFSPDESQGPGSYTITTVVTDNGVPPLSATNSFTVTVNEVNTAPVLPAQPDRTINALGNLIVTNTATDADLPANTITYKLLVAPNGGFIDTNGVITWTAPSPSQSVTNDFMTVATDDGVPPLSATNHFSVVVNPAPTAPLILSIAIKDGTASVVWTAIPGYSYRLDYKDHLEADWITNLPPLPATTTSLNMTNAATTAQRFYRVVLIH